MQPNESLYDQKLEEVHVQVSTSINSNPTAGSSFTSRFEYTDNVPFADIFSVGSYIIGHVAPAKSSGFFSDNGMDSAFQKKNSSSSKPQSSQNLQCSNRTGGGI